MTDPTPVPPEHTTTPAVPAPRPEAETTVPAEGSAHDPWSREAETVSVAPAETAAAEGFPPTIADAEPAAPRRRRTTLVLAIVAVVVVLLGAGAYAGERYWTGAGTAEPESAVPADVAAFARIDLDPGVRDKLAVDNLVKKFPNAGASTTDLVTKLESSATKGTGLDYTKDVKPWFGGQAGAAEWTNASGDAVSLLVFASTDDGAAKAALAKAQAKEAGEKFGYVVTDGFALIAGPDKNAQGNAAAAATAAKAHNLADSSAFTSAKSHLSGNNLALAYVDLAKLGKVLTKDMTDMTKGLDGSGLDLNGTSLGGTDVDSLGGLGLDGSGLGGSGLGGPGLGGPGLGGSFSTGALMGMLGAGGGAFGALKGTAIVGGSVVDNGVEVRAHLQGSGTTATAGTNVRSTLDAMPDTTLVGLATDGVDPSSATMKQLAPTMNGAIGALLGGPKAAAPDPKLVQAISSAVTNLLTSKVISLALTGLSGDLPSGFVAFDIRDAASAQSLMDTVKQLTGGGTIPDVTIANNGTHVQASMGGPASSGKLSSVALYQQAMNGMSQASSVVYVDVAKLVATAQANGAHMSTDDAKKIAPVKAVGIAVSKSGATEDDLIRVIITK